MEFQKDSAGTRPKGSLREVRERLSPTPARRYFPLRLKSCGTTFCQVKKIAVRHLGAGDCEVAFAMQRKG